MKTKAQNKAENKYRKSEHCQQYRKNYQQGYRTYLSSNSWQVKRFQKRRHHNKCAICGSTKNLAPHYLYYPKDLTQTKCAFLRMLCDKCHNIWHSININWNIHPANSKVKEYSNFKQYLNAVFTRTKAKILREYYT